MSAAPGAPGPRDLKNDQNEPKREGKEPVSHPHLLTPEEKLAEAKKLLSLPRIVVICGSTAS